MLLLKFATQITLLITIFNEYLATVTVYPGPAQNEMSKCPNVQMSIFIFMSILHLFGHAGKTHLDAPPASTWLAFLTCVFAPPDIAISCREICEAIQPRGDVYILKIHALNGALVFKQKTPNLNSALKSQVHKPRT